MCLIGRHLQTIQRQDRGHLRAQICNPIKNPESLHRQNQGGDKSFSEKDPVDSEVFQSEIIKQNCFEKKYGFE